MYPILIKIGSAKVYTYGFFIIIGYFSALWLASRESRRTGYGSGQMMELSFWVMTAAVIGARFFYIITDLQTFIDRPVDIFKIAEGGLVFYGSFAGGLVAALIYLKKMELPIAKTFDMVTPCLPLTHFFGRIGCFFAGCCYGEKCDLPWAVSFSHPETMAPKEILLHPVQLYSAVGNLAIFTVIWFLRDKKKFDGQLFFTYVIAYGLFRTFIEFFRDDFRGPVLFGAFSVSQAIGIGLSLSAAIGLFLAGRNRTRLKNQEERHA